MQHREFCQQMQPFIIKNLDEFDLESLVKIRNNYCHGWNNSPVLKIKEASQEYTDFTSCLEMRIAALILSFGKKGTIRLRPSFAGGKLLHSTHTSAAARKIIKQRKAGQ